MERIKLNNTLEVSRLVHGYWRARDWQLPTSEIQRLIKQSLDLGISTFDHADIYGDYSCEAIFGEALKRERGLRGQMQIISKCGIQLVSDARPQIQTKHYDYSYKHIVASVEQSLLNLQTDYLDVLLLHRPSPYMAPEEIAKAFVHLQESGKVLHFGVSNFTPQQYKMLDAYLAAPLVTNQVEVSPYCLEHFDNENIDFFLQKRIKPMAWSPLSGGRLLHPNDAKGRRIYKVLTEVAEELSVSSIDAIIYAWLLQHPVGIIPVVGTQRIERLRVAAESLAIKMNVEQWLKIYTASTGVELP